MGTCLAIRNANASADIPLNQQRQGPLSVVPSALDGWILSLKNGDLIDYKSQDSQSRPMWISRQIELVDTADSIIVMARPLEGLYRDGYERSDIPKKINAVYQRSVNKIAPVYTHSLKGYRFCDDPLPGFPANSYGDPPSGALYIASNDGHFLLIPHTQQWYLFDIESVQWSYGLNPLPELSRYVKASI